MSKFNVHEWNHKRRLDTINEDRFRGTRFADLSASTLETFLKKKLAQFKSATNSKDRTTNYQLNAITEIIGFMADLQVDGILDKNYVDQQIKVLAPKFQEIIDNASDNFIQGTDYERSDLNEQELAIDEPGNPLYDLNNNDRHVAILNSLIDKYGLEAVQLWITSGEYPGRF